MPALIGILLVMLVGFQLFFRYEHWSSKTNEGVSYERDRLTGETHVLLPGDKVNLVSRIMGNYGHDPSEVDRLLKAIPEPQEPEAFVVSATSGMETANEQPHYMVNGQAVITDNPRNGQGMVPVPTQAPVYQQPTYATAPVQGQRNIPQESNYAQQSQHPYVQVYVQPNQGQQGNNAVAQNQPTQYYQQAPSPQPQAPVAVQQPQQQPRSNKPTIAFRKESQPYQMNMTEMSIRSQHQLAKAPIPATESIQESFRAVPLVPNQKAALAKKIAAPAAKATSTSKPVSQGFDLNRDGSMEQVIHASRSDGSMNISVVQAGREMFFAQGQQLQILPSRKQGWSDLALINTNSGYKHIYQYDSKSQGYVKTQMVPLRPSSIAQSAP